jgi:hypothetical protein
MEPKYSIDPRLRRGILLGVAAPLIYGLGWAAVAVIQVYSLPLPFAETLGIIAYFSSVIPILPAVCGLAGVVLVFIGSR